MAKETDVRPVGASLYFLPVETRVPLKFGGETLTEVICARASVKVADRSGRTVIGWGETPLSVQWVWPSGLGFTERQRAVMGFCEELAGAWARSEAFGHPVELGHDFQHHELGELRERFNAGLGLDEPLPYLAALLCLSVFDIATHDAYGKLHGVDIYKTYNADYMNRDLAAMLEPAEDAGPGVDFTGRYPADYLDHDSPETLRAWHLVGGLDPLAADELTGDEPDDGYPVLLGDWIERDGLKCLKVKLRGTDAAWDYKRLLRVGDISLERGVEALSADFNCTVTDPVYVNEILDRLRADHPRIYDLILYVEQPFPHDLEAHHLDVSGVSERKPLFLDESAHDWRYVRLGRELGWSGVALKTCKTQSGALLSLCWAKAHGMPVMVQDLTNPMLAQVPHVRLAAHAGTIMGVETNAMQFYPEASNAEAAVHPGLYRRREGRVDLSTLRGPGFGYRLDEIDRELPEAAVRVDA